MLRRSIRAAAVFILLVAGALGATPVLAAEVPVAVAANFTEPAKEIAAAFRRSTGDTAVLSFGASGQFYAQITHGAPYQVFLSADVDRPVQAEKAGVGVPGTRFVYATGKLVLFSRTPGLVDDAGAVLRQPSRFARIAIADPGAAPYGAAAVETMTRLNVYGPLKAKIVQGASINQAWDFTRTGAAELGFVALSEVVNEPGGSRWIVPDSLHAPIDQDAILLAPGDSNPAARRFLAFLRGPEAKAIIVRYGYTVH
ncbi:molybdate ABC transporter substrate-binding protein [Caulobacter sp. S45]|uniref:molybdate ABC transporter substrate-binding protein n=1 Tax=Caulobacter sp. S45 TaxID=1641861 RepID=UPI0015757A90